MHSPVVIVMPQKLIPGSVEDVELIDDNLMFLPRVVFIPLLLRRVCRACVLA